MPGPSETGEHLEVLPPSFSFRSYPTAVRTLRRYCTRQQLKGVDRKIFQKRARWLRLPALIEPEKEESPRGDQDVHSPVANGHDLNETEEPGFLRAMEFQQKQQIMSVLSQAVVQYNGVNDDVYDESEQLGIPRHQVDQLILYLRSMFDENGDANGSYLSGSGWCPAPDSPESCSSLSSASDLIDGASDVGDDAKVHDIPEPADAPPNGTFEAGDDEQTGSVPSELLKLAPLVVGRDPIAETPRCLMPDELIEKVEKCTMDSSQRPSSPQEPGGLEKDDEASVVVRDLATKARWQRALQASSLAQQKHTTPVIRDVKESPKPRRRRRSLEDVTDDFLVPCEVTTALCQLEREVESTSRARTWPPDNATQQGDASPSSVDSDLAEAGLTRRVTRSLHPLRDSMADQGGKDEPRVALVKTLSFVEELTEQERAPVKPKNPVWSNEVVSIQRKPPEVRHVVELWWRGFGSDVHIAGSFTNWMPQPLMFEQESKRWVYTALLPLGSYTYKFIVDGQWVLSDDEAVTYDVNGNCNNELHVTAPRVGAIIAIFQWRGHATHVDIVGSFTRWQRVSLAHCYATVLGAQFEISVFLVPGWYRFKYVVKRGGGDETWEYDKQEEFESDGFGGFNNVREHVDLRNQFTVLQWGA